ncbi:hypothetical protein H257_08077 [Aphanomyces astaci]|uniref:RNA exonuclease 4 n=1 Tax=Aphanomyces astaci TaxID=112090 RepID=W4GFX5_APHAT|nr:hypothetical protein H257_08077 [Aphanomyces astaci]ETV78577.1 hypothetical protein H257_08077 [Aphanomyces astaci]|eukprot:XP_009832158.1 hypothetical protein H257_08077 [Aphanomyces astaci]
MAADQPPTSLKRPADSTASGNGGHKKKKPKTNGGGPKKPLPIAAGSNWAKLKPLVVAANAKPAATHNKTNVPQKKNDLRHVKSKKVTSDKKPKKSQTIDWIDSNLIVAMDCEMVGVGVGGTRSVLARCSIVDFNGDVVYDEHVKPLEKVTDYRTHVSGIRSKSFRNAISFAQCQVDVGAILKDKILVGHAVRNDLQALMLTHPKPMLRDTTKYRPYMRRRVNGTKLLPKALRHLALEVLDKTIQAGEHDSVIDARTTLELYKKAMVPWEKALKASKVPGGLVGVVPVNVQAKDKADKAKRAAAGLGEDSDDDFEAAVKHMQDKSVVTKSSLRIPDAHALVMQEYDE